MPGMSLWTLQPYGQTVTQPVGRGAFPRLATNLLNTAEPWPRQRGVVATWGCRPLYRSLRRQTSYRTRFMKLSRGCGNERIPVPATWTACLILLTVCLIPRSWVILEKPLVAQRLNKVLTFYGTRRSITVSTRTSHWYLSSARRVQSITSQPTSPRYIVILFSQLFPVFPSALFPPYFLSELQCTASVPIRATCLAHLIVLDLVSLIIFHETLYGVILCNPLLLPFSLATPPAQHPVLKHPQSVFLP
jgi:hypothetical protein